MIKVMFVCLGNICRSPMAEFVLRDMVKSIGLEDDFVIASAATSDEALGCSVHHGTANKLSSFGISTEGKYAVKLKKADYEKYDYIIAMEERNIRDILKIIDKDTENKVYKLLDFAGGGDIADPWYTGNFDVTYEDIKQGCEGFLNKVYKKTL